MSLLAQEPPKPTTSFKPTTATYEVRLTSYNDPKLPESIQIVRNFNTPLTKIQDEIKTLHTWPEGWNGYDVAAPNPKAIDHAISWIESMYEDTSTTPRGWREPHVTASEDGDVLFEWRRGAKGLSIYVSETEVSYIKDWGADLVDEMEDGPISTSEDRRRLWDWLMG